MNISKIINHFSQHKLRTLLVLFICMILFSCKKNTFQSEGKELKEIIATQPIERQRAYVDENLKVIGTEIGRFIKEPNFKKLIYKEITKKFDGDYNVLIKTLLSDPEYGSRLNTQSMRKALDAFKDIEGENLYPQIFIPSFEKHHSNVQAATANNSLSTSSNTAYTANSTTMEEVAVFAFYDGNETVTEVPGYVYNEDGNWLPAGITVNEQYSVENEVIVISLNETIDNNGDYLVPLNHDPNVAVTTTVNFRIETMHVKDNKESFLAGNSEVSIKAWLETWNHRRNGEPLDFVTDYNSLRSSNDYKGHKIRDWPRSEISSGQGISTINYPLQTNWQVHDYDRDPIAFAYIIFEYDGWPAGKETADSQLSSTTTNKDVFLTVRTSNSPYAGSNNDSRLNEAIYGNISGIPNRTDLHFNSYRMNTPSIEFNTKKY